jgi:hypothetical protein
MAEANRPLQMHVAGDLSGAEGVDWLLASMPDAIRSADDHPVGFVLDIDPEPALVRACRVLRLLCYLWLDAPSSGGHGRSCSYRGYGGRMGSITARIGEPP